MKILDVFASLAVSILAGMGVGGGGLMVVYLTFAAGMSQIQAQGVNILFFLSASLGAFLFNRKKRRIDYKRVLVLSLSGVAAAVCTALLCTKVDSGLLRKLYGGLLVISGIIQLCHTKRN